MRLLDLFSGAGGAAKGYHDAGFDDITGVDNRPMPHYPYRFILGDALDYCCEHGAEYDVIHASPPCQYHTVLRAIHRRDYLDLIPATRESLQKTGLPYVIENVMGAPLVNAIVLCGTMFGLRLFRHRQFESNILVLQPDHQVHTMKAPRTSCRPEDGEVWSIYGHFTAVREAMAAMGTPWMNQKEGAQAIPPAYTEWIGKQIIEALR